MDAGAIKQAAAIIQSEGVFIDSSPLGEAAASKQRNRARRYSRIRERRVADIRTMICLRKSLLRALVETCSNYPESCDRDGCRWIRIRRPTVLSMIGPNRAAVFNRGRE